MIMMFTFLNFVCLVLFLYFDITLRSNTCWEGLDAKGVEDNVELTNVDCYHGKTRHMWKLTVVVSDLLTSAACMVMPGIMPKSMAAMSHYKYQQLARQCRI